MTQEKIGPNQWLFVEMSNPGYFIYRLLSGKVSIYMGGAKINEIEVKEGGKPALLGIFCALRKDRMHTASVKTDTDVTVERVYVDQVMGALRNDVPEDMRDKLSAMIDTIIVKNEIESLKNKLKGIPKVSVDVPEGLRDDIQEVLGEIKSLYDKFSD